MLDRWMRPLIDPPLNRLGRSLARAGLHAKATITGQLLTTQSASGVKAYLGLKRI